MTASTQRAGASLPVPRKRAPRRRLSKVFDAEARTAYVLIAPMVLVFIFVLAYPLGYAMSLSFQKKALGLPGIFIGLENYRQLVVEDLIFPKLVRNTLLYVLTVVIVKSFIGLLMALVLNERIKGRSFFRGLLMMPWVTPQAVVAMNWKWILQVAGVLNFVLVGIGLVSAPIPWLAKPGLARFSVILINIWANFPFFAINFLAAMQTIPRELYEAAEVDGASTLHRFIHVTWPGIRQSYLVLVILSTIWTWNAFTHIWLLTGGGPVNSTHVFATYSYQVGLSNYRLGYAAAISLIFLPILVLMVNIVSPLLLRSREEQIW